jgi:hypothetical protein
VHECETAYTELSSEVFGKEQSGKKIRYDVMTLEKNIENVLARAKATRETKLLCHHKTSLSV